MIVACAFTSRDAITNFVAPRTFQKIRVFDRETRAQKAQKNLRGKNKIRARTIVIALHEWT